MDSVPKCPFWVKAIYSSSAEQKGDLGFIEGDLIQVLNLGDGNWWNGQLHRNKTIGQFPRNYIELYSHSHSDSTPNIKTEIQSSKGLEQLETDVVPIKSEDSLEDLNISIGSKDGLRSESPLLNNMIHNISQYSDVMNSSERITHNNSRSSQANRQSIISTNGSGNMFHHSSASMVSFPSTSERSVEKDFGDEFENSVPNQHSKITIQNRRRDSLNLKNGSPLSSFSASESSLLEDNIFEAISSIRLDDVPVKQTLDPLARLNTNHVEESEPSAQHYSALSKLKFNLEHDKYKSLSISGSLKRSGDLTGPSLNEDSYAVSDDEESSANNYEPFSPDSYKDLVDSLKSGIINPQRDDSFKGTSPTQKNTSLFSHSSPISLGILGTNSSSKLSLGYFKTADSIIKPQHLGPLIGNLPHGLPGFSELEAETPVELPRSSRNPSPFPDLVSQKSQIQKKSSGFLKKLFGNASNTTNSFLDASNNNTNSNNVLSHSSEDHVNSNSPVSPSTIPSSLSLNLLKNAVSNTVSRKSNALSLSSLTGFNDGALFPPGKNKDSKPPLILSNSNKRPNLSSSLSISSLLATPETKLDQNDPQAYIEMQRNVHRANTLTIHEKEARKKRYLLRGNNIVDPLYLLSQVEGDETVAFVENRLDVEDLNFDHVDKVMNSVSRMPKSFTPTTFVTDIIGREFGSALEQLRAIFVFCAEEISWEKPGAHSELETDFSRVLGNKRASAYELAVTVQELCQAINVYCEVVRGYLKAPGEIFDGPGIMKPNHSWNAVLINNEWRFIDCSLASPSHPARRCYSNAIYNKAESFYFLAHPTEMIFTHVPNMMSMQHIKPPLDHRVAYALPLACPAGITSGIELVGFDNSSLRLEDLEVGEIIVQVPNDVEIVAEVQAGVITAAGIEVLNESSNSCSVKLSALSQVFWKMGVRYYRIKALLPPGYGQGVLNIYAGHKGSVVSAQINVLPIALSLPITHSGKDFDYNFVMRHPTLHCKRQDIYICDPQCRNISAGSTLKFSVDQHPSNGINAAAGFARTKIAIRSPSHKIYKLTKQPAHIHEAFGCWSASIKCLEVGTWKGLVLADTGSAWNVFAEWQCT
ncbi:hypothetical protein NADFUDRAFT_51655 [Nadsonia fulvescens var. elongata DSM 6958]|uniref:SH3 domain-containing protein n=1 Tax=Nadsonia fulvescens var. elongata DSM 6958 TaxID=857566 RepID=A0A1E3PI01_9ASCO|nr:hypothetical protein NADFUDRAFT_51655 [Nadsonia fulvescens var. elongata DSM 6958]